MIEIKTKIGTLYLEGADDHEEDDRLKLYDSNHRYLDYYPLDSLHEEETIKEYIDDIIEPLSRVETVDELMDELGVESYTATTDWTNLLEDIYGDRDLPFHDIHIDTAFGGKILTEEDVMKNELVNKIGDTYIFIAE